MFDGAPDRPRQEARDLVSYLETLGRARELAGPEGEAHARQACNCPDDHMAHMAWAVTPVNGSPARTRPGGEYPALPTADLERGKALFAANCATCHGSNGKGDGPAAAALLPRPSNLAEHRYPADRLSDVLWNGSVGTAMSAWRDHPVADLAAMAAAVQSLSIVGPTEAPPEAMLALGARVYEANCIQCHGVNGDGRGTAVAELVVAPTDFRRQQASLAANLRALREGMIGTRMATWTDRLNAGEILAVAHYVRSLYQDAPTGREQPR
jgi:mono/diheme cytochrome c family protein